MLEVLQDHVFYRCTPYWYVDMVVTLKNVNVSMTDVFVSLSHTQRYIFTIHHE